MATDNNNKILKVPNLSFKQEQSETCFDSAERVINQKQNVPNLRFPEFTEDWVTIRLGDSCDINMCKRIFANQTSEVGDIPFYKIGTIGTIPDSYISKELFEEYKQKYNYPRKGEVMITCAGTVGKAIVFNGEDSYYQDSNIVWIDNPTNELDNTFLYYKINCVDWSKLNSTTITRIYNDDLRKLKISYPSIAEQIKITKLLQVLDQRIATQNKIIQQLQSLIKGIVVEHYNKSHKTKFKIKDLGRSYSVMNMSKEDLSETGNECIIYGELFTTYDCVATNIVSKTEKAIHSSTVSTGYDLLFPASTTVDAQSLIAPTAISQPNIILGGDMFGIAIKQDYNNEYLSYIFNYVYKNYLARYAQGSTIIHLHYNDIQNLEIELPDINTQNELVLLLHNMQDKVFTEKKMLSMYETQKAYLLNNLFI